MPRENNLSHKQGCFRKKSVSYYRKIIVCCPEFYRNLLVYKKIVEFSAVDEQLRLNLQKFHSECISQHALDALCWLLSYKEQHKY